MRSPIAQPGAQRSPTGNGCTGTPSRPNSPTKDSVSPRPNYLTRDRLYEIKQELSSRDWLILEFIAPVRLATGRQLIRNFWSTTDARSSAARAGRRTLKRLSDWRVLDPLPRRIGGRRSGSGGMVYGIGLAGVRLLSQLGLTPIRPEAPGALYVNHTLAITEARVELSEASRPGAFDLIEVQNEPQCWRGFLGPMGVKFVLKPDLFVRVGVGAYEDRWFIEVDLGTEASGTIVSKAKRYLAHYRSGNEQAESGVYPRVLWAVPDDARAGQVLDAIGRLPGEAQRLFAVCHLSEIAQKLATEARS